MELGAKAGRYIRGGVLFLVLAAIFVTRMARFVEPDFFMHLRVGQWILENRAVPRADVFSHVAQGLPWTDHEWLFQLLLYLLHRIGGWPLLAVTRCTLLALSYYFTYRTCRLLKLSFGPAIAFTVIAASMAMGSVEFRPQVITYVLFPLYFQIMLAYLLGHRTRLWLLPLLIVPWANMHGAFVAVFVLGALLVTGELIKHIAARLGRPLPGDLIPMRRILTLVAVLALTFFVTVINPYGIEMWFFPFKVVQHPIFFQMIFEWMPPEFPYFTPFWTVVGLYIIILIPSWRHVDFRNTLLILAWTYLSLSARRNIVLFGYVVAPVFGQVLYQFADVLLSKVRAGSRLQRYLRLVPDLVVYLYAVNLAYTVGKIITNNAVHEFGIGVNSEVPVHTADFIMKYKLAGNMFNEYNVGGYLIYRLFPDYLVYQDGRVDVYGPDLFREYKMIESGNSKWRAAVTQRNLNFFVLTYGGTKFPDNLAQQLDDDPEWDLVHFDNTCLVYVRNSGPNHALARRLAYHAIKPGRGPATYLTTTDLLTSATAELDRAISEVPDARPARILKLYCLTCLNRYDEAARVAEELQAMSRDKSEAWRVQGRVALLRHKYDEAAAFLKKAAGINPAIAETWMYLGQACEALGRHEEALQVYLRAARLSTAADMSAYVSVARVASRLGKDRMAMQYWDRYLEARPMDIVALNDAGTLSLRSGDVARAITLFNRAAEISPENPAPYYNLACAYTGVGDFQRALEHLREALLLGGPTVAQIAQTDADIAALRALPQFTSLIHDTQTSNSQTQRITTATLVRTISHD